MVTVMVTVTDTWGDTLVFNTSSVTVTVTVTVTTLILVEDHDCHTCLGVEIVTFGNTLQ
jgi:hypothetical protein